MALLVPAAALPAQLISPGHFNLAEGNLGISDGIGSGAHKNRFLQLIKMAGRAKSVNWIDVRRDGDSVNVYEEGAVVADMDVPELKQTLKLGKGLEASAGIDLGKIQFIEHAQHGPQTLIETELIGLEPEDAPQIAEKLMEDGEIH